MALTVPKSKKAKRVRSLDGTPTQLRVDPNYWVDKYAPVMMEAGLGGVVRSISSFVTATGLDTIFAGIAEESVVYGQSCSGQDGVSRTGHCWISVHKEFEMDVELIANPTVAVNHSNFDPIAAPIYIVPWQDPNGGGVGVPAVSNRYYNTSLSSTNSIGVIKQLCPESSHCERPICASDKPAPADSSAYTPIDGCPILTVYASFKSALA